MTEYVLTDGQRRAVAVLALAESGQRDRRPVRISDRTSAPRLQMQRTEMLTIHWKAAGQLIAADLIRETNPWLRTVELTDAGRQLAREAGLG